MSMVFIQDVSCCCGRQASCQSCSLASAEWSTYAEIGAGASERTRSQAWSRAAHQGGRVSEEGRWRRLTAWVSPATEAEGEGARLAAAPQTYPAESEVVRALRAYNQSLVRAGEGAFTLEAAEKVIGQVYARQLSQWWASKGAASQPADVAKFVRERLRGGRKWASGSGTMHLGTSWAASSEGREIQIQTQFPYSRGRTYPVGSPLDIGLSVSKSP